MISAIVLIKAVPCQESLAYTSIKAIKGIKKLYTLFGDHDFLAIIDTADQVLLKRTLKEIETLNSVISVDALLSRTHLRIENRGGVNISALQHNRNYIDNTDQQIISDTVNLK